MPEPDTTRWIGRAAVVAVAAAVVLWIRLLPLSLGSLPPAARDDFRFRGDDGREHVYLGDYDSYLWVRHARDLLRKGTTCNAVVDGECRDTYANAPVGAKMRYGHSLHIAAIAAVHRVLDVLDPGIPLTTSAYGVAVLVGVVGVLPAIAIGWRLAGPVAGLVGAIVVGVNSLFLYRSLGADNDVWNVVLPLATVWAVVAASDLRTPPTHRLVFSALAGIALALHAAIWSGWVFTGAVVAAGMGATVCLSGLRVVAGREGPSDFGWTLATAGLLAIVATAGVALSGASTMMVPRAVVRTLWGSTPAATPLAEGISWPDVFATVGELFRPGLGEIANQLQSLLYFFVAWLGLVLVLLPERGWQWWHFVVLVGGNLLYRYLLSAPPLAPSSLVWLLGLPLFAGGALSVFEPDSPGRRGGLVVVAWFLGALLQSFGGIRFVLLLVPPFGILFGVAVGRLHAWLVRVLEPRTSAVMRSSLRALLFAASAVVVLPVIQQGRDTAQAYRPMIHDGWWDALTHLRETTPPDAIVTTWWDYGHWIKYVAERRVTSDGSTLSGRVSHWIGRMLLAPSDREAAGLLRMLDCGSDVGPTGAMGRLATHGVTEPAAYELARELATLDRDAAQARLLAAGLTPVAATDVLAATHCTPPPAYLVLTTAMTRMPSWLKLGGFDPRRELVMTTLRANGGDPAAILRNTFGMPDAAARTIATQATRLRTQAEIAEFENPSLGYLGNGWLACRTEPTGDWTCPVGQPIDSSGTTLDAVRYRPSDPASTRLLLRGRARAAEAEPASLVVAGANRVDEVELQRGFDQRLAVLMDLPGQRALVGPADLLRSAFTRLVLLDGRSMPSFKKVDDRTAFGERIVTWRVHPPS